METLVTIDQVRTFETSKGNVRYVIRDSDGNEYTTFREAIGDRAQQLARLQLQAAEAIDRRTTAANAP